MVVGVQPVSCRRGDRLRGVPRNSRFPVPSTSGCMKSPVLVDEVVLGQLLHQDTAAEHDDGAVPVLFSVVARGSDGALAPRAIGSQPTSKQVSVRVTTYLGVALRCAAIGPFQAAVGQYAAIFW